MEWISIREMNKRVPIDRTAQIDPHISQIAGKPIRVNDPRLITLVTKWKRKVNLDPDGTQSYNFHNIPGFVEDVKQVFSNDES